ncbi:hypothetical protein [Roseitranquillus sediminis]|uniref:hypothetical protein n=1 Tax=Roseitranquillus sediminis TaxID=2809051 RepID=UPI001D0CB655|nr:hypothetical protein [Roseitranquillus sediminis]MBM9595312.1 hypothetical protein [Roseitranquillus sediminis]
MRAGGRRRDSVRRVLWAGTALLSAAAVGVGLALVGGPRDARMEREDEARLDRLHDIAATLRCDRPDVALPAELSPETLRDWCGGRSVGTDILTDPFDGSAIRYERRSDRDFSLCATFHDPARLADDRLRGALTGGVEPESGCLLGRMDG